MVGQIDAWYIKGPFMDLIMTRLAFAALSETLKQRSWPPGIGAPLGSVNGKEIAVKLIASFARAASFVGDFACGDVHAKHEHSTWGLWSVWCAAFLEDG